MEEHCPHCGVKFEREPGFFLGSIYFNYGLTALLATAAYVALFVNRLDHDWRYKGAILALVILCPLVFHRFARSLWLGFDQWYDPRPNEQP
jgi:hypothetical protein